MRFKGYPEVIPRASIGPRGFGQRPCRRDQTPITSGDILDSLKSFQDGAGL